MNKRLQAETPVNGSTGQAAAELDALLPAILKSLPGSDPTGDRAWTHPLPARSGYAALSLREMDLLVPTRSALRAFVPHCRTNSFHRHPGDSSRLPRSQRARLKGEL
jgi:hypothetical protein